jgi:drug/metabolite transporter (DMT)-like permease
MSAATVVAPSRRNMTWYFFLMALASLMWAAQGTAVKVLDRQMGPIAITFLPFYITTILFVPLLWKMKKENPHAAKLTSGDWIKFAVAGIGGQVLAQLGMTWGISKSLASNGAILNLLIPVFSAVLASILLRERITLLRVVSLGIGLAGVVLLSVSDLRQSSFGEMRFLTGNVLILGGCLGSSFYNVYCKGLMQRFTEIEILIYSYITASIASVPLLIWVEPFSFRSFQSFDWKSWAAFAFLALFMYGASMLLFFKALQHLDVTTASASLYLVPVFGVLLAAALLGERLGATAIIGSVIVLSATVLIMKYDASY